jgi:hypothetical protein
MEVILSVPGEGYFERHLMKVILSVTWWRLFWASPDDGYFERHLMKVILSVPDEGYFERHLMKVILSVTWWRLFQKRVMCTNFDIYDLINISEDENDWLIGLFIYLCLTPTLAVFQLCRGLWTKMIRINLY